jgi:hypothetical protein
MSSGIRPLPPQARHSFVVSSTTCPASVTVSTKPRPPHSWHGTLTEIVSSAEERCPPSIPEESSVWTAGADCPLRRVPRTTGSAVDPPATFREDVDLFDRGLGKQHSGVRPGGLAYAAGEVRLARFIIGENIEHSESRWPDLDCEPRGRAGLFHHDRPGSFEEACEFRLLSRKRLQTHQQCFGPPYASSPSLLH